MPGKEVLSWRVSARDQGMIAWHFKALSRSCHPPNAKHLSSDLISQGSSYSAPAQTSATSASCPHYDEGGQFIAGNDYQYDHDHGLPEDRWRYCPKQIDLLSGP